MERMLHPQPEATEPQPEELLKQLQSAETRKFLINACRKNFNNLPPETDIEDIIQTTLAKAAQAISKGKYRGEASLTTWLHQIVNNTTIDAIRKRKRFTQIIDKLSPSTPNRDGQTIEDIAIEKEEKENQDLEINALRADIEKLPSGYRIIMELLMTGKRPIDIAKDFNINIATINTRIRKAKQLLLEMAYGKQNKNIPE
jgi:RNA polymerase sigma factor (sigma-70 family)